jgi:hypothetical protein
LEAAKDSCALQPGGIRSCPGFRDPTDRPLALASGDSVDPKLPDVPDVPDKHPATHLWERLNARWLRSLSESRRGSRDAALRGTLRPSGEASNQCLPKGISGILEGAARLSLPGKPTTGIVRCRDLVPVRDLPETDLDFDESFRLSLRKALGSLKGSRMPRLSASNKDTRKDGRTDVTYCPTYTMGRLLARRLRSLCGDPSKAYPSLRRKKLPQEPIRPDCEPDKDSTSSKRPNRRTGRTPGLSRPDWSGRAGRPGRPWWQATPVSDCLGEPTNKTDLPPWAGVPWPRADMPWPRPWHRPWHDAKRLRPDGSNWQRASYGVAKYPASKGELERLLRLFGKGRR